MPAIRRVLTIAGSDSGGGAGIQADLKAFARCGVHGMTAITMVTAQSTTGVQAVHPVAPEVVVAQIRAVAADIGIDAIKIGMLGNADTVAAVAGCLLQLSAAIPIVVDPVLVATSGAELLDPAALAALIELIVPLATVLTPNLPEAQTLVRAAGRPAAGVPAGTGAGEPPARAGAGERQAGAGGGEPPAGDGAGEPDALELARSLHRLGTGAVVVTGGHRTNGADLFYDGADMIELTGPRHPGGATHGSGCTHSAVLAAELARGRSALEAARIARVIAAEAVGHGRHELGAGEGPVDVLAGWVQTGRPGPSRLP